MISSAQWGEMLTIAVMAFAIGLDAFSLGIAMGMKGIRLLHILRLSTFIALFHLIMPLMGMFTGSYMSILLGDVAVAIGGVLLILLGAHMIYSSLRGDKARAFDHGSLWGTMLFAFTVSIDSFSVGVSLGMFASDLLLTVLLFGLSGGYMSILGLLIGRGFGHWAGEYGEAVAGAILLAFGIKFLS
jgi:putative Mn2+ efflux pump MntP